MSYSDHVNEDVRLIVLRELHDQANYASNDTVLVSVLETFGHHKSKEYLRGQIKWLAETHGCVNYQEVGSVWVVTLTRRGKDHVEGREVIDGIKRPSPRH